MHIISHRYKRNEWVLVLNIHDKRYILDRVCGVHVYPEDEKFFFEDMEERETFWDLWSNVTFWSIKDAKDFLKGSEFFQCFVELIVRCKNFGLGEVIIDWQYRDTKDPFSPEIEVTYIEDVKRNLRKEEKHSFSVSIEDMRNAYYQSQTRTFGKVDSPHLQSE